MKKILLIGDSIRMGYCHMVKEDLSEVAEVVFPEDNCRFAQYIFHLLHNWTHSLLGNKPEDAEEVAAIHWNCGHWDCERWGRGNDPLNSIATYSEMVLRIQQWLERHYPHARIFFATTTPMSPTHDGSGRTTSEIADYNRAAVEVLRGTRAEINDLFSLLEHAPAELYCDIVHLTEPGYRLLADEVSRRLRDTL